MVATPLASGQVLVMGADFGALPSSRAERYDAATNTWTFAGIVHRVRFRATLLDDGRVLVTGGMGDNGLGQNIHLASAAIYDPVKNTWAPAGSMSIDRLLHSSTRLADGRVLVAGGNPGMPPLSSAESYDPATGKWIGMSRRNVLRRRMHKPLRRLDQQQHHGGTDGQRQPRRLVRQRR